MEQAKIVKKWLFLTYILASLLVDFCSSTVVDLHVDIAAGKRECFYQPMTEGQYFEFEYRVLAGGGLDVNFFLQGPNHRIIVSEIQKTNNIYQLTSDSAADYAFCFDNTFSHVTNKLLRFYLYIKDDVTTKELAFTEYTEILGLRIEDFMRAADSIENSLRKSIQHQRVFGDVELRDRSIQEYNFERINFWSSLQLFVMVSTALANLLMIRALFERSGRAAAKQNTKLRT